MTSGPSKLRELRRKSIAAYNLGGAALIIDEPKTILDLIDRLDALEEVVECADKTSQYIDTLDYNSHEIKRTVTRVQYHDLNYKSARKKLSNFDELSAEIDALEGEGG